jgi:hypothetical protein
MMLIEAALNAPLIAINPRWKNVMHAAEMETIIDAWPNGTVTSVCGKPRLRLLAGPGLWPPRVKGSPMARCRDCWEATGKKRPRSTWVPKHPPLDNDGVEPGEKMEP